MTDGYEDGSAKEMRKWIYEIFSTFLADGAVSYIILQNIICFSLWKTPHVSIITKVARISNSNSVDNVRRTFTVRYVFTPEICRKC